MKEIKLTRGKVALVDDEDYKELIKHKWHYLASTPKGLGYAACTIKKSGPIIRHPYIKTPKQPKATIGMHRLIMGCSDPKILVDHIDGNGLNNQRCNLRLCSVSDNMRNRGSCSRTSSYIGVNKRLAMWEARINTTGKFTVLGLFRSEEDAALAYDKAAIASGNPFFRLNFPEQLIFFEE